MRSLNILLLLCPIFCYAQLTPEQENKIDSLKQVIETAAHDTTIINAWFAWDEIIYSSDPILDLDLNKRVEERCEKILSDENLELNKEENDFYQKAWGDALSNIGIIYYSQEKYDPALKYYNKSLVIDKANDNQKGIAKGYYNIGLVNKKKGNFKEALEFYEKGLSILEGLNDSAHVSSTLNNIGSIHYNQGDFEKAIEYYTRSLKIKEALGDKAGAATTLNNIGLNYFDQDDYAQAIIYYNKSLTIQEQRKNKFGISLALNNIGSIYKEQEEYSKALEYYNKSLAISKEIDKRFLMGNTLNNIGEIYKKEEEYDKSLEYHLEALEMRKDLENKAELATSYNNIGEIYYKLQDYDKALDYFNQSLDIGEKITNKINLIAALIHISDVYTDQGQYAKAIGYSNRAYKMASDIGRLRAIEMSSYNLYRSHKALGNQALALKMHEVHVTAKDSIENETNQKEVIRQEYKYAYEKQALADSIAYVQEQEIAEAKLSAQRRESYFLYAGLGLSLLLGGFIYNRFRVTSRQKKIIEEQKKVVEIEKGKSENLLLNILPKETAEELKEKGKVGAQSFEMASVLFTDFKGFSRLAGQMTPQKLVAEIDYYFSAFDQITERYGIEKIKTIGDAYMAVGGVPKLKDSHALDTLNAALEIAEFTAQKAAERKKNNEPFFEIRIGIHSGPIVAGVVGLNKFQYDVWGDSVNIASRMESQGESGKVNISESTYQLIKDNPQFKCSPRGKVEAKGHGELEMYFVEKTGALV